MEPTPAPRCTCADELRDADGGAVTLCGTYLAVPTLRRMPCPGRPREEVNLGEVVIVVEGSAAVYDPAALDNTPARVSLGEGPRSVDEIAAFDRKRVEVEGRLVLRPGASDQRSAARMMPKPMLQAPTALRLAE